MALQDREVANHNETQHPMVSSADFARKFGQLRQMQDEEAIFVTHHGPPPMY